MLHLSFGLLWAISKENSSPTEYGVMLTWSRINSTKTQQYTVQLAVGYTTTYCCFKMDNINYTGTSRDKYTREICIYIINLMSYSFWSSTGPVLSMTIGY